MNSRKIEVAEILMEHYKNSPLKSFLMLGFSWGLSPIVPNVGCSASYQFEFYRHKQSLPILKLNKLFVYPTFH